MPNLHLRELPPTTLEILKAAALAHGRSLNAELVHLLTEEADYIQRTQDFLANVQPRKPRKPVDLESLIRASRAERGL